MPGGWREVYFRSFGDPIDRRPPSKVPTPLAPRSLFALASQWARGRDRMLTFRIAITAAVMAFIMALTASLVLIQVATFHVAAKEAASAAMDAASANTLSRLEAQVSELNAVVRVLSTNPSLTDFGRPERGRWRNRRLQSSAARTVTDG